MTGTLGGLFLEGLRFARPDLLRIHRDGKDLSWSPERTASQAHRAALALRRRGIAKGDAVAILSENRPEWLIADFGITFAGGVVVPLYLNLLAEQVGTILRDARPKLVFVSSEEQAAKVRASAVEAETVCMDGWERFLASGAPGEGDPSLEALAAAQSPDDLASLLYTSGTTGEPKGVQLTHRNLTAAGAVLPALGFRPGQETVLSFLPLAHIFGRVVDLATFGAGATIAYAPSLERLGEEMRRYRPTVFAGVPRVFEKAYGAVQSKLDASPAWRRRLAKACLAASLSGRQGLLTWLGDRLVFRRIREGMGGRLRIAISGGAPLSADILRFFQAVGVPVYEGYGLTETGVVSVNVPGRVRPGSIGPPLPGMQVRFDDDGEILVKGDAVMKGFRNETLNREAFDAEGWFRTGDLGRMEDGLLFITGRKKELMKTSGGKYIAPSALEQALCALPLVAQAMVVADGRPYPAALVVPDPEALRLALGDGAPSTLTELCAHPRALEVIEAQVERGMEPLPRYERVKRVGLLRKPLTVEAGELTPTLKLKRAVLMKKFAAEIEAVYQRPGKS